MVAQIEITGIVEGRVQPLNGSISWGDVDTEAVVISCSVVLETFFACEVEKSSFECDVKKLRDELVNF